MDDVDTATGIDALIQRTANMVELTMTSSIHIRNDCFFFIDIRTIFVASLNRRHMEYLPYPDANFEEEFNEVNQGKTIGREIRTNE